MRKLRRQGVAILALGLFTVSIPVASEADPVIAARSQRAAALGVSEDDLPPVPRSIIEPPPLPPPEIHPKDLRPRRGAKRTGSAATRKGGPTKKASPGKKSAPAKKKSRKSTAAKGQ
jgi:hypothetical protein